MTPQQNNARTAARLLVHIANHLPAYDQQIAFQAEPSMAGGGGRRASGVSDPTAGALANAEKWLQRQRQLRATLVGIAHSVKAAERELLEVLAEAPLTERERMRASCKEVFCDEWASVNPKTQQADRKGFCIACYFKDRRHPIDSVLHEVIDTALGMGVATQVVAPIVASQPDATPNMVYCSVCVTDYPLPLGVDLVAWKAEHRASCG